MNVSANSSAIAIDQVYGYALEIQATGGSAAGSLQVQESLAQVPVGQNSTIPVWSNVGSAITISGAGSQIITSDARYSAFMRVVFTASTGGAGDQVVVKFGMKGP